MANIDFSCYGCGPILWPDFTDSRENQKPYAMRYQHFFLEHCPYDSVQESTSDPGQQGQSQYRNFTSMFGPEFDDPLPSSLRNKKSQKPSQGFNFHRRQKYSNALQRSSSLQRLEQLFFENCSASLRPEVPSPRRSTSPQQQQPSTRLGSGERSSPSSPNGPYKDDKSPKPLSPSYSDSNSDVPSLPESSTGRAYLNAIPDLETKLAWFEDNVILLQEELRQYREERNIHDRKQLQLLQQLAESKTELQDWLEVAKKEILVSACSAIERGIATFLQILPEEVKTVMRQNLTENHDRSDMTAPRDILTKHRDNTAFVRQPDMDQIPERGSRQDAIVDNRPKPKSDQGDTIEAQ